MPILICDEKTKLIAAIHAGWKGVKNKIHIKAIKKFIKLDSDLSDYINPYIDKEYDNNFSNEDGSIKRNPKYFLDYCLV